MERVRQAELEWFNYVEQDARRSVDSGIILRMVDEVRRLRAELENVRAELILEQQLRRLETEALREARFKLGVECL